jgi:hypothetical protein
VDNIKGSTVKVKWNNTKWGERLYKTKKLSIQHIENQTLLESNNKKAERPSQKKGKGLSRNTEMAEKRG